MGAPGTGKSRLSVDLATDFRGEIINSDKMQVFKGLEIVTNKITHGEKQGVRHYLLGEIEPDSNFTAEDFCLKAIVYIEIFLKTQCVRNIVGGSNSYFEKLLEDPVFMFKYKCDSCFIWIDVEQSVLNRRVDTRVDEMVSAGQIEPYSNFTVKDFCVKSIVYIENFLKTQCVPIIVGGSNSYIEKLVEDPVFMFKYKYDSFFIWIDVEQSVLNSRVDTRFDEMVNAEQSVLNRRVDTRVDEMVNAVDEVRQIFIPDADYTKGIRRSIGVPEMAKYLREEKNMDEDDESKKMILQASISSIKHNTRKLICNQLEKIQRLINEKMWPVHHIIATDVFEEDGKEAVDEEWRNTVLQPCLDIVKRFLKNDDHNISIECT
ncbi:adenylate isopentenyltransferase 5, chloroplastic-like [Solanum verrucosum]|uniref:adenylate isopentenyltransferase 5, chloroplastic-like n=1 Tax=Solanum verrucosum TaxID=315347 RepID=UPI0020D007A5|nr:adenylate isopentenyltransferase 5, chloroplastic-like [Solanum verrucosum]